MELVKLDRFRRDVRPAVARTLLLDHLSRRPSTNPVEAMGRRIVADLDWLRRSGEAEFHLYAFATCRQCGASAELGAAYLTWAAQAWPEWAGPLSTAAREHTSLAETAKSLQFNLARVARGRHADVTGVLASMTSHWQAADLALAEISRDNATVG